MLAALMMVIVPCAARAAAGDASSAEVDQLKKEIEDLRRRVKDISAAPARGGAVERALDSKYGPNAPVSTKNGKLTIGGLLQVWYYSIRNDHNGSFDDTNVNGIPDTNEASDNDSFRIRRAEILFNMDIHENVTAVVKIDPAAEANSFPLITDNQANAGSIFKTLNNVAPEFDVVNGTGLGNTSTVSRVQLGSGSVPRLLKDAYINYHGVIPHHDFTIGQFIPAWGEEGMRSSAQLDFVERSFVGLLNEDRDLGIAVHGTWLDDRVQYWLGLHNGAGNYFGSGGSGLNGDGVNQGAQSTRNRSDDNDAKDFSFRVLARPIWNYERWGCLELGWSSKMGAKGESGSVSGGNDPYNVPINGLNRASNWATAHDAWASYRPGGPVKGWWLRGEWAWIKDRMAPGTVVDVLGAGLSASAFQQENGAPLSVHGWYFATGYKISDSVWADSAPSWLKPWEFTFRYQTFENVMMADLINPAHTDVFKTQVFTGGVNYYIKGHNAKIQVNYNAIKGPQSSDPNEVLHDDNNSLVVNFQVSF